MNEITQSDHDRTVTYRDNGAMTDLIDAPDFDCAAFLAVHIDAKRFLNATDPAERSEALADLDHSVAIADGLRTPPTNRPALVDVDEWLLRIRRQLCELDTPDYGIEEPF